MALTDPVALGAWLMPNDFEATLGHRFTFRTDPGPGFDGIVHCEVLTLEPPRRMVWSWRGGPLDTTVHFTLSPVATESAAESTRLDFEQRGFEGPRGLAVSVILERGFGSMFGRLLPAVLDRLAAGEPPTLPPRPPPHPLAAAIEKAFASLFARRGSKNGDER